MKSKTSPFREDEFLEVELTIHEAMELIEFCQEVFQQRLSKIETILKRNTLSTTDKDALEKEAKILYEEYNHSLAEIESCIDDITIRPGVN